MLLLLYLLRPLPPGLIPPGPPPGPPPTVASGLAPPGPPPGPPPGMPPMNIPPPLPPGTMPDGVEDKSHDNDSDSEGSTSESGGEQEEYDPAKPLERLEGDNAYQEGEDQGDNTDEEMDTGGNLILSCIIRKIKGWEACMIF